MRDIEIGPGGLLNPDAHLACGPRKPEAQFLEPVHWGGCKECAAAIRALYRLRLPPTRYRLELQRSFGFMDRPPARQRIVAKRGAE